MTISEAASLVIKSVNLTKSGDIFILNMGEPIKIYDLAKKMIKMNGLSIKNKSNPYGDIEITFIGLRKGEKLKEELWFNNNPIKTQNKNIFKEVVDYDVSEIENLLNSLYLYIEKSDEKSIIKLLKHKYINLIVG